MIKFKNFSIFVNHYVKKYIYKLIYTFFLYLRCTNSQKKVRRKKMNKPDCSILLKSKKSLHTSLLDDYDDETF